MVQVPPPQPKQILLLIQSCRQRYRYFTAKNIGRISTYKNKRCILGAFHPSCNAFFIVFIAPPRDLTQYSCRPIVKQLKFVKQPVVKKSLFLLAKINFFNKILQVCYELSLTNIDFTGIIHTKECDFYVYYFERWYLESVNCI